MFDNKKWGTKLNELTNLSQVLIVPVEALFVPMFLVSIYMFQAFKNYLSGLAAQSTSKYSNVFKQKVLINGRMQFEIVYGSLADAQVRMLYHYKIISAGTNALQNTYIFNQRYLCAISLFACS